MDSTKLGIVCVSDAREPLQMAAMIASVAAVSGRPVLVLVAMNALRHFVREARPRAPAQGRAGEILEEKHVTDFQALFAHAIELGGARIHPCSMAMDVLGLARDDLDANLGEPMGLMQFLDEAAGGQLLSF
ncbi:MAG TPA: DsrE/DsrF/DrsH-like family protein [Usitatibacter sp.]|jgi:peroxiredoxin family protein|nr:DsrE/DsrF/DrsH-like family protein [Usitatibacter sp.]